ncbi:putative TetR family transcriptional regulator [Gordonia araii NBRC 100433]|uniref:Putative TetR family transcriptional regulator n=1 Tax=Gordonia araii NBRC 100433 TaxID=1073574 RepID=G7H501_9ACTN|nr:TetR/AcrR family transcriptional regulator [Gordonia araii]NNG96616.1 TetR/AcrR family transcriptional regulator [Gordonia araii NBRC 100433]GAB10926.1 putative TetR family transcriptional regulator [Gordonia araii NBRC 100433]
MTTGDFAVAGRPRDARIDGAVLEATRALLAEVGYADLTLTAVAARARTSVPALRRRWPSKAHVVHHAVFPDDLAVPPRAPDSGLADEVATVVDNCIALFSDRAMRRAITGLLSDLVADDELQRELTARLREVVWNDLEERFTDAARRDGVDLTFDPSAIVETAFGATLLAVVLRGTDALDAQWREMMAATLLAGCRVAPPA